MANFNYTANVKCVNGEDTWIEVIFPGYVGTLETDITSMTLTGPSGLISNDKADFLFYESMNHILYLVDTVAPEIGDYTFSITIGGETIDKTDTQTINRSLPFVDNSVSTPLPGAR